MSLVSVMMPAKNTEKYISLAIQSIIDQTYTNWELIIVDDRSIDRTREIAESFAKKDNRIKVYDGEGICAANARNKIIDLSNGMYIMLMDSDDTSVPNRMEVLLTEAEKHTKSFIGSNLVFTDPDLVPKKISDKALSNKDIRAGFKRFYNRETLIPGTVLAHRSIYVQHRYRDYMKSMEDWDLVLRISEDPEVYFENIKEPLYFYRLNSGSETLRYKTRIPYNLLLRYNEILRRKGLPELTSLEAFEEVINKNIILKMCYNFFFFAKRIQHKLNFRNK